MNLLKKTVRNVRNMIPRKEDTEDYDYDYDPEFDIETDNTRWELDYDDVLTAYEKSLKNEVRDNDGRWILEKGVSQKLNNSGVRNLISDLKSIMHKGTALSNFDEEFNKTLAKYKTKQLAKELLKNRHKWGVDDSQKGSIILNQGIQVFGILQRAKNDGERKHRTKKQKFIENYRHDEVSPDEIRL